MSKNVLMNMKKLFAAFVALAMVVTLLPQSASATLGTECPTCGGDLYYYGDVAATCQRPKREVWICTRDYSHQFEEEVGDPIPHNFSGARPSCTMCGLRDPSAQPPTAPDISAWDIFDSYTITAGTAVNNTNGTSSAMIFDGNSATNWTTGQAYVYNRVQYVEFTTTSPVIVKGYIITTPGGEVNGLELPVAWKLSGKTSAGDEWTVIDEVTEDHDLLSFSTPTDYYFSAVTNTSYNYFRFEITNANVVDHQTVTNLAELALYGVAGVTYTHVPAVAPTCTEPGQVEYWLGSDGRYYTDDTGSTEILDLTVPANGHSWQETGRDMPGWDGCDSAGVIHYACSACGVTRDEAYGTAPGHNWVMTERYEPGWSGCLSRGRYVYVCSVCGESKIEAFGTAPGHNYVETERTQPTCTSNGLIISVCTECESRSSQSYAHALGHDYVAGAVIAPTCTQGGYTEYYCTRCGNTIHRDETAALGHVWAAESVTEPTCTQDGFTVYRCLRCGETRHDDITAATPHNWVAGAVTEPTCTAGGYTVYTCADCGAEKQDDITEALGHVFGESGNSYHDAERCSRCGEKRPGAIINWADLQSAFAAGGSITLTRNYYDTSNLGPLVVPAGVTLTIDLKGHTIDRNDKTGGNGLAVIVRGTLIINDTSRNSSGRITGATKISASASGAVTVKTGGSFTLNAGAITGNSCTGSGGCAGVYVEGGATFAMNGGVITNNTVGDGTASGGCGLTLYPGSTFTVSGNPYISGNVGAYGDISNIYMMGYTGYSWGNTYITLTGPLVEGARLGVSAQTGGSESRVIVDSSWGTYMGNVYSSDPEDYITAEHPLYMIRYDVNNSRLVFDSGFSQAFFNANGNDAEEIRHGYSGIRLPEYMHNDVPSGQAFKGWRISGSSTVYDPGTILYRHASTAFYPVFGDTWGALYDQFQSAPTTGAQTVIKLMTDVIPAGTTSNPLRVLAGANIVLDLNGHTIDRHLTSAATSGYVIDVKGTLVIRDSRGGGRITGGYNAPLMSSGVGPAACIMAWSGASLTLEGGTLTGNQSNNGERAAAVVAEDSFTMTGGSIVSAGGTYEFGAVTTTEFTMTGGTISGYTNSGCIAVTAMPTINMSGGTITDCYNAFRGHELTMSGGTVTNCHTVWTDMRLLTVSGSPRITGNDKNMDISTVGRILFDGPLSQSALINIYFNPTVSSPSTPVSQELTEGFAGNGSLSNFVLEGNSNRYSLAVNERGEMIAGSAAAVYFITTEGGVSQSRVDTVYRSALTLPECMFTAPENKVFAGWQYGQPGETMTVTATTVQVVASWSYDSSLVTVDPGIVSGTVTAPASAVYNSSLAFTVVPDTGCALVPGSLEVTYTDGNGDTQTAALTQDTTDLALYSFTVPIPASDIYITAAFYHTWAGLAQQIAAGGLVRLQNDYAAEAGDAPLTVPSGVSTILDLNGHSLTGLAGDAAVSVAAGGTLTLRDTSAGSAGVITGADTGIDVSGTLNVESGAVTGCGTGVYVNNGGVFSLKGNYDISGNTDQDIYLDDSVITVAGPLGPVTPAAVVRSNNAAHHEITSGYGANMSAADLADCFVSGVSGLGIYLIGGEAMQTAPRSISISAVTGGSVTASAAASLEREEITLTATADTGYILYSISVTAGGEPVAVSGSAPGFTFIMPDADVSVTAVFVPAYEIIIDSAEHGSVSADADFTYEGGAVALTVTPEAGYELDTIAAAGSSSVALTADGAGYTFTMPGEDVTVTASFRSLAHHTVTVSGVPAGTIIPDRDETYVGGTVVLTLGQTESWRLVPGTLTVSYQNGSETAQAALTEVQGGYSFVMPGADVTVTGTFAALYSVSIAPGITYGTLTTSKTLAQEGESVTLTATPQAGCNYVNGSIAVTYDDGVETRTITPTQDGVYWKRYHFIMPAYPVSATVSFDRSEWVVLDEALSAGGTVTLTQDVTAESGALPLIVPAGVEVTLDLNGFTIDRALTTWSDRGYVIIVESGATLTITDSSQAQTGSVTGGLQNNSTSAGGGIVVLGALVLEGGSVAGNSSKNYGGGVFVRDGGSFVMNGGSVEGNTSQISGGGVYVESGGSFVMNGGSVTGNTSSSTTNNYGRGGGIYLNDGGAFAMNGGSVTGNTAKIFGGGITTSSANTRGISLSGDISITGNTARGQADNVYLMGDSSRIVVNGALSESSRIGVGREVENYSITSGLKGKGSDFNFVSDAGKAVGLSAGGEAILADAPAFTSLQLVLDGQIGMYFFANISSYLTGRSYMDFEINGVHTRVDIADAVAEGDAYRFLFNINSVQMADDITATLYYNGGENHIDVTVTAEYYLNVLIANEGNDPEFARAADLAKAINDYGYYAQFSSDEEGRHVRMAKAYRPVGELITTLDGYAITGSRGSQVSGVSYSLSLTSETKINLFFTTDMELSQSNTEVTASGATFDYTVKRSGTRWLVQITGINADELGTAFTVTLEDGTTVSASAMSYVQRVLTVSTTATDEVKHAAAAMYEFFVQAGSYTAN